jgi:hypothetical protein
MKHADQATGAPQSDIASAQRAIHASLIMHQAFTELDEVSN